jgi:hypothetical protein
MSVCRPLALALAAATGALAQGAIPTPLAAQQFADGRSYFFRLETPEDGSTEGVMHVVGDRARIEIHDAEDENDGRVYLLLTNGGRTLVTVHPDERSYTETDAAKLEGIIGTAMRAVDVVMTMNMVNSSVNAERLGDGGEVAGLPTQRYRLSQEFEMEIGMMGQTERARHRIVSEYWVNDKAGAPRNPIVELVTSAPTALAQVNERHVARVAKERASLFTAAPLKVVVHAVEVDGDGDHESNMYEYEVTRILPATIDLKALSVPDGYHREHGKGVNISW